MKSLTPFQRSMLRRLAALARTTRTAHFAAYELQTQARVALLEVDRELKKAQKNAEQQRRWAGSVMGATAEARREWLEPFQEKVRECEQRIAELNEDLERYGRQADALQPDAANASVLAKRLFAAVGLDEETMRPAVLSLGGMEAIRTEPSASAGRSL